jgi:hypothetical protein
VIEDLLEGIPVDVEHGAGGALAQVVDHHPTADLSLLLHVGVHP